VHVKVEVCAISFTEQGMFISFCRNGESPILSGCTIANLTIIAGGQKQNSPWAEKREPRRK